MLKKSGFNVQIKRVFWRYELWEDYQNGLFNLNAENEGELVEQARSLLANPSVFENYAREVVNKWKRAAEVNLSNSSRNRQAWIGQAACCLYCGAPEYVTKQAWNELSEKQQKKANKVADKVILEWERAFLVGSFRWFK